MTLKMRVFPAPFLPTVFFSFPHVAVNASGELGKVSREGRHDLHACGALLKAQMSELQGQHGLFVCLEKDVWSPTDADENNAPKCLVAARDIHVFPSRICAHRLKLVRLKTFHLPQIAMQWILNTPF